MPAPALSDGVVTLRPWEPGDGDWYAATAAHDPLIQRFTCESPEVTGDQVWDAIEALAAAPDTAGFLISDAVTGARLGNIALAVRDGIGDVSYWLAAPARGRGVATRALRLFTAWSLATFPLTELRLWTHAENAASQAVAQRAGFRRDPDHDQPRQVRDETWPATAYALRRSEDP